MDRELSLSEAVEATTAALRARLHAADPAVPLGDRPPVETWQRQGDNWACVETGELAASCPTCGGPLAPLCRFCPPEDRRG